MLRIVPKRSHDVAIVVIHHDALVDASRSGESFHELVHQTVVKGGLFVLVTIILVAGDELGENAIQPFRVGRIRVIV